jgi:hypothetical protein
VPTKRQKSIREGKERYKRELTFVINEMNELDPAGLVFEDTPWDEYSMEAQKVLAAAKRSRDHVELQKAMCDIFQRWFGVGKGQMAFFRKSAKKIFKEVRYS